MTRDMGTNVSNKDKDKDNQDGRDMGTNVSDESSLEDEVDKTFGPGKLRELMDELSDNFGLGGDQEQDQGQDEETATEQVNQ